MNKQALTFLSLFSLILMLSIYYILLPPVDTTLPVNDIVQNENEDTIDFSALKDDLETRRNNEVAGYNAIIASSSSSVAQITEALEKIDMVNVNKELENQLTTNIKELGYEEVFVELSDQVARINVKKENGTSEEVTKIINTSYQLLDSKYLIEVKFIS
ncbi:MAG: SpoIIIAH-like family protein [Erysipelotrichaceae bacterium]|nr:SpoIIIAH-like family protein [Erysipelotrichaceae bacterium]